MSVKRGKKIDEGISELLRMYYKNENVKDINTVLYIKKSFKRNEVKEKH